MKQREVPANTDLPLVDVTRHGKRPRIARHDFIQHRLDGTDLRLRLLVAAERNPIGRGDVLMDQQPLHRRRERAGAPRQAIE
ncbi:hypothetical protein [Bradyrhizobium erythrophlei]|uniref:hypothetical protein n=1 Tax=Bradyrhizobium erythrophlei TaxID=1437360 RepID=UPI001FCE0030|nr:hypothetical protein [Bradyrhizobium erythrophlei]